MKLLAELRRDAIIGVRLLTRYPAFSIVAIVTLAAGIGGNAAVFAIVNALLLTPPPVFEPAQLARVDTGQSLTSWPNYLDLRDGNAVLSDLAAHRLAYTTLDLGGGTTRLRGEITSPNYLKVLGVPAAVGRTYEAGDTTAGQIVLAHHVWRQQFGADAGIVGRTVLVGGRARHVIGVMPRGFRGVAPPGVRLDFWQPVERFDAGTVDNRAASQFGLVGRLRPGTSHEAATAALRPLALELRRQHPGLPESFLAIQAGAVDGVHAFRGMASLVLPVFAFLVLLAIVSGFVLVIGCSNIAGLLLGRAAMRRREIAVRLSLGSSAGRLVRQLLTESLVIALAGGAAGLLLASMALRALRVGLARLPFPLELEMAIDWRVIGYTVGFATATALVFGLLPARAAVRVDLLSGLKADASGSRERQRLRRVLVTAQVTVAAVLVLWSALFLRSLGNVHAVDPGFDASDVVLSTIELDRGAIDAERGEAILTEWTRRVSDTPGVQSAALATVVPLALTGREEFDVSLPSDSPGTRRRVVANRVSPGWFATVRVPLLAGRDFTWDDRRGSPAVAIVNETLARQFWHGRALGERVQFGARTLEVVGIARDIKYRTLGELVRPHIYLPIRQEYAHFVTLHARTSDQRATAAAMNSELSRLLPAANAGIESMRDAVAVAVLPARIGAAATGLFGMMAMALAAIGVYGLVAFHVAQRTREFGIRRAIGATAADIVRIVVRQHAVPVAVGLVLGMTTGAFGAMVLRGFLTGVGPTDPLAILGTATLVVAAALASSVLPSMRAAQVNPTVALRDL